MSYIIATMRDFVGIRSLKCFFRNEMLVLIRKEGIKMKDYQKKLNVLILGQDSAVYVLQSIY